jgi:sulfur-oxidizing protein SoxX
MPITRLAAALAGVALVVSGCALLPPSSAELDAQARAVVLASFRDQGIAKVERLRQDLMNQGCSTGEEPSDALAERIRTEAMASVRWPTGGQYFGNWVDGERIAQSGRGMTWTDASTETRANGGNCYNCHQIDEKELSHGTLGPSLWHYGRNRGVREVADMSSPVTAPIIQYTWAKLWNSHAYLACSNMPRFGHQKLLDEQQLRHLMSLLLDPRSPVNR